MSDLITNGWVQSVIAIGCLLGLLCFFAAWQSGILRFPTPKAH